MHFFASVKNTTTGTTILHNIFIPKNYTKNTQILKHMNIHISINSKQNILIRVFYYIVFEIELSYRIKILTIIHIYTYITMVFIYYIDIFN